MKKLRQTCTASILTLVLAMSAFAGQIQCPGAPAPVTPESSVATSIVLTILSLIR